ncbi:hypothetical protein B4065_3584 [Caldibacillus thermoamylovorans]|nr:hypothetical protein B4065_3584 [Caldibacillus thermoamylovorans]
MIEIDKRHKRISKFEDFLMHFLVTFLDEIFDKFFVRLVE